MEKTESLEDYYWLTNREMPKDLMGKHDTTSHFNILKRDNCSRGLPFVRRDYWKISLLDSKAQLELENQTVLIDKPCIVFSNPDVKYGWRALSNEQSGFICLFNDEYLNSELKSSFKKLNQLLKIGNGMCVFLESGAYESFTYYFQKMYDEYAGCFDYKKEIIQNLLQLVVYDAIKIQHKHMPLLKGIASTDRVVKQFLELLESQFPVDSPQNPIELKAPSDFAEILHVHVNHLNHCLKSHLGKSTTQVINARIVSEAIDLLENSDWNITEIAESLGFEYLQHFTHFFKKKVGVTPKNYRANLVFSI